MMGPESAYCSCPGPTRMTFPIRCAFVLNAGKRNTYHTTCATSVRRSVGRAIQTMPSGRACSFHHATEMVVAWTAMPTSRMNIRQRYVMLRYNGLSSTSLEALPPGEGKLS
jgi:hypothetical protein